MVSEEPWKVDSHQHFWDPARGDYPWMPPSGPLVRSFLPRDLRLHNEAAGIAGSVVVQAAPTLAETEWLLDLAEVEDTAVFGVVGWVDLEADDVAGQLDRIMRPRLVGVRPMVQDLPEDDWIVRPAVIRGLQVLAERGLVLDLLARPRHLAPACRALEQVPDLMVVVNHLAKPDYSAVQPFWAEHMSALAQRERTAVKVSGLVTEVSGPWRPEHFRQHVDRVLDAFGPGRILLGTDWPVLEVVATHAQVCRLLDELIAQLSASELRSVWRDNCLRMYGMTAPTTATR